MICVKSTWANQRLAEGIGSSVNLYFKGISSKIAQKRQQQRRKIQNLQRGLMLRLRESQSASGAEVGVWE